ncbi:MAG: hypothetical protein HYT93_04060 [Parcubacteria group bacterium]|nr:hypothetical protein [Parcubacteria group bacterium]
MEKFKGEKNPFMDTYETASGLMEALEKNKGRKFNWERHPLSEEEDLYTGVDKQEDGTLKIYVILSKDSENSFLNTFDTFPQVLEFFKELSQSEKKQER